MQPDVGKAVHSDTVAGQQIMKMCIVTDFKEVAQRKPVL